MRSSINTSCLARLRRSYIVLIIISLIHHLLFPNQRFYSSQGRAFFASNHYCLILCQLEQASTTSISTFQIIPAKMFAQLVVLALAASPLVAAHGRVDLVTGDAGGNGTALAIQGGVVPLTGKNKVVSTPCHISNARDAS